MSKLIITVIYTKIVIINGLDTNISKEKVNVSKQRNSVKIQLLKHHGKSYDTYYKDYAVIRRAAGKTVLQIRPYRRNLISYGKEIVFRQSVKKTRLHPQKITKQWFVNHRYTTCYFYSGDMQYSFNPKKDGVKTSFDTTSYWDSDMPAIYRWLVLSGDSQLVAVIKDKNDSTKANFIFENTVSKSPLDVYYFSYYAQRISKNYLQGLKSGMTKYKGHSVRRIKSLENKRVVRLAE